MLDSLICLAVLIAGFAAGVALCLPWARPARPVWLVVCLGYVLADGVVTLLGFHLLAGLHWNWAGKGFSVLLAAAVIAALRPSRAALPLGLPADPAGWRWSLLGVVAAGLFAGVCGLVFRDHVMPGVEDILYQATMPGLAEELCWRGLVFVLLGRAYAGADGRRGAVPAAVMVTLLFGLIHGVQAGAGGVRFAVLPFAYAVVFGAGLAVVRLRGRSLVSCVVAHNVGNVIGAVMNGVG